MKNLFLLLILFVSISYSQPKEKDGYIAFSGAFDVVNAFVGSEPTNNKPALDVFYQFAMVGYNGEVNIGYERFNEIGFSKYTIGVGYHFPLYNYTFKKEIKTVFIPSIEPTLIDRWDDGYNPKSHLTIGGNLAFRWLLSNNFGVEVLFNALPRVDLKYRNEKSDTPNDLNDKYLIVIDGLPIVTSTYLKFIWVINNKYVND